MRERERRGGREGGRERGREGERFRTAQNGDERYRLVFDTQTGRNTGR